MHFRKLLLQQWYLKTFLTLLDAIQPGDIIYINGAYTSLFKGNMILYEGKKGVKMKIGEFYFNFSEEKNVSLADWSEYLHQKSK